MSGYATTKSVLQVLTACSLLQNARLAGNICTYVCVSAIIPKTKNAFNSIFQEQLSQSGETGPGLNTVVALEHLK